MHKQEEKNLYLLGWILLGIFLSYLLIAKFSHFRTFFHLPCLFRTLTGYYCPGCGGTGMYRLFTWTFFTFPALSSGCSLYSSRIFDFHDQSQYRTFIKGELRHRFKIPGQLY